MLHTKIDLNLFIVLQSVYDLGSITLAAKKLHLTQPAVSHAIARLRDKFNDPLFVRHGRKMVPTELCQRIMPSIHLSLQGLHETLSPVSEFDIHQHDRLIRLGLRDILESIFFPPLMTDLVKNTPNIRINSEQIKRAEMESALNDQSLDIVIDVLTPTSSKINSQLICNEHFSLICRPGHPILEKLSLAEYVKYPHAIVSLKDSMVNNVDMALAKHGCARDVVLRCEHYFAAASVVCQCDMLLTMPNAYANILKDKLPVEITTLPFDVPHMPVHMYWHKQVEQDPVNNWLREKLLAIAKQLFPNN
ncbi:LysR family transcriptional regulator [Thalassotalea sp. M1531]|uniref:LysR family transcriptional regulator n=1 Tax=Thalassotalea algicola TaxID=2716224 RepID=A0A7Y0LAQ0_9GAMM|nr:LysR family transcriptional regulator [Thalassotalea algicola]NMP30211.1 LysR family transcriptional regulator [Thalassotalea algicola]